MWWELTKHLLISAADLKLKDAPFCPDPFSLSTMSPLWNSEPEAD